MREWTKIRRLWRSHFHGSWFDKSWRSNPLYSSLFWMVLTTKLTAYLWKSTTPSEVISKLHEWMDTFHMTLKAICADMAFHHPHDMQTFYRMHNVKRFPTGPHTVNVKLSVCVTRSSRGNEEAHNQEPTTRCIVLSWQDRYWHQQPVSEYKDSPKDVQSSLGKALLHMKLKATRTWAPCALSKMNFF